MRKVTRRKASKRKEMSFIHQEVCHSLHLLICIASSLKSKRTSSADTIREYIDDSDESDQALDLAALKRARRENPGTISILGSLKLTDGSLEDDEAKSNAEKAKQLFDLPSTEKIITGTNYRGRSECRISCLVVEDCYDTGLYALNRTAYMFLCAAAKDERLLQYNLC